MRAVWLSRALLQGAQLSAQARAAQVASGFRRASWHTIAGRRGDDRGDSLRLKTDRHCTAQRTIRKQRQQGRMGSKIYVGNLPFSSSEDELRELFEEHGSVESVSIITDRETGRPRGFGFVQMETSDAASSAIRALDGKPFGGRPLRVSEAQERDRGGDRGGPRRDMGARRPRA